MALAPQGADLSSKVIRLTDATFSVTLTSVPLGTEESMKKLVDLISAAVLLSTLMLLCHHYLRSHADPLVLILYHPMEPRQQCQLGPNLNWNQNWQKLESKVCRGERKCCFYRSLVFQLKHLSQSLGRFVTRLLGPIVSPELAFLTNLQALQVVWVRDPI